MDSAWDRGTMRQGYGHVDWIFVLLNPSFELVLELEWDLDLAFESE